ncbi:MAG: phenylacetate--CoA ligase family protein [Pseudomonadales bacterium]
MIRSTAWKLWQTLSDRSRVPGYMQQLQSFHTLPAKQSHKATADALRTLMRKAGANVPYYQGLYKEHQVNVDADDIFAELTKLPPMTKALMEAQGDKLHSSVPGRRPYRNSSGGSTGKPAIFRQDRDYQDWSAANKALFATWAGWQPGQGWLKIWGAPKDIFGGGNPLKKAVRAWALNESVVNCYQTNDDSWRACAEQMRRNKPAVIESYATAMDDFTEFLAREKISVPAPAGVITSAGRLESEVRQRVRDTLGCPALDRYGSREVGDMSCACPEHNGLHLNGLVHYLEILDPAGNPCPPGVEGEIFVTLLTNHTMPLLRYQIGDMGIWAAGPCACGRTSPILAEVSGRVTDSVVTPTRRLNGVALATSLVEIDGLRQFQYLQSANKDLTLSIVFTANLTAEQREATLASIKERMDKLFLDEIPFVIKEVESIPKTATGKYRYVISEL